MSDIATGDLFASARARITPRFIEDTFGGHGAHWDGKNFKCLNPKRSDATIGSFSIREDGVYFDFADGDSGDVIDLLSVITGKSIVDVAKELSGISYTSSPKKQSAPPSSPKPDWKPFSDLPPFSEPIPSFVTAYHSKNIGGEPMFIVIRRDLPNGKEIFPLYFTGGSWVKGLPPSIGKTRPLVPFDQGKTILIVEGEKCQSLAARSLKEYSVTTWHGGAVAARMIDISGLNGSDVILWPDNDDPGMTAMIDLAARLKSIQCRVRMVNVPFGKPKAWDIADCLSEELGLQNAIALLEASRPMSSEELGVEAPRAAEAIDRNESDLGNAERFIDRYGKIIRFNTDKKRWCIWGTGRWSDREQSEITPMVKETIRSIADEDPDRAKYALDCESRTRIKAMLELASLEPGVSIHETDFDLHPMILNCRNGILDLKENKIIEHDPKLMCSMMTNIEYKPEARAPRFKQFLSEITRGRKDIEDFMQRWFGYALTGDVSAQTFAIFYGNGANGKSTLVELISRILGDYVRTAPPETFIQKPVGGIPNDVASLRGSRLVLATETDANAKLAESKVKGMTGGDTVVARFLHGEFFQFSPTWKIIISTNHRPRISGADYGIWRRIVLVPFDFVAIGDTLDYDLPRKLWEEREGVLSWMVEGCHQWMEGGGGRTGLGIPPVLLEETQEYREDEDIIGRFVKSRCITDLNDPLKRTKSQIIVGATELYQKFIAWAEEDGERYAAKMTQTSFGRAMRERGYNSEFDRHRRKIYEGIQIDRSIEGGA
jgi:putative DNA primase/helicase